MSMLKLNNWLNTSQKWKKRLTSFINKTTNSSATENSVGKKQEDPVLPSKSYSLYDSCQICPLKVYADVVCNDNLKALIISGNPSNDILEETKVQLIAEFNDACGDPKYTSLLNKQRDILIYKTQIIGLAICAHLIAHGNYEQALEYLNQNGMSIPKNPSSLTDWMKIERKINARIKMLRIKIKEKAKQFNSIAKQNSNGQKCTIQDFNDQLIQISKNVGFRVTWDISLLEFAGYLKDYNNTITALSKEYAKYRK